MRAGAPLTGYRAGHFGRQCAERRREREADLVYFGPDSTPQERAAEDDTFLNGVENLRRTNLSLAERRRLLRSVLGDEHWWRIPSSLRLSLTDSELASSAPPQNREATYDQA